MAAVEFNFNSSLPIVQAEFEAKKEKILYMLGLRAEGYAKKACPADTGRLRNSISFATSKTTIGGSGPNDPERAPKASPADYIPKGSPAEDEVVIGTNVEYAVYVELGSRGRKGRKFLQRAANGHSDEYKMMIEMVMKDLL